MVPILTWSKFYPGRPLPREPLEYFRNFALDDLVQVMIWAKNSLELPTKVPEFVHALIRRMEETKRRRLAHLFQTTGVSTSIVIDSILVDIFRTHTLKISDRSIEEMGFEDQLVDLLLYYNELHYSIPLESFASDTPESMWALSLAQATTGLSNIDYARTSNIKHLIFLKFLRLHFGAHHQSIEESFRQRTGLANFHLLMFALSNFYLTTETGAASQLVLPNMPAENCVILEQLSLVIDQAELPDVSFNIGKLAGLPYYKTGDRIYVLSRGNFAFALEKSWPYFLYQNSNLRDFLPGTGRYSDFQGLLGKSYVEDYFLHTLFSSLDKKGFRWIRPTEKYMPDGCYVINESTVILFEFKSSSLHYNVIAEQDLEALKTFLSENFASGKKGAPQLAKAVKHLATNAPNAYAIRTPLAKLTVYPVIIYTDPNLCMLGINDYVDECFQSMLGKEDKPFRQIKPLCMVHADFITENLTLLDKDRSLFKDSLDHYLKYKRKKQAAFSKTKTGSDYLPAQYQFDRYVIGYRQLYRVPQGDIFRKLAKLFDLKH